MLGGSESFDTPQVSPCDRSGLCGRTRLPQSDTVAAYTARDDHPDRIQAARPGGKRYCQAEAACRGRKHANRRLRQRLRGVRWTMRLCRRFAAARPTDWLPPAGAYTQTQLALLMGLRSKTRRSSIVI